MTEQNAPERIWAWCFNPPKFGGWAKWGGYARDTNMHPLDDLERETGARFVREDLYDAAWNEAIEAAAGKTDEMAAAMADIAELHGADQDKAQALAVLYKERSDAILALRREPKEG